MNYLCKMYYFSQEYEVENDYNDIDIYWLETEINPLKGVFHLECIERIKESKPFIDNQQILRIDYYTIGMHDLYEVGFCEDCVKCSYCEDILDPKLIVERQKILDLYNHCDVCGYYCIPKEEIDNMCKDCIEHNEYLDNEQKREFGELI